MKYNNEIMLIVTVLVAGVVALILKNILSGIKKPNGQRKGLVSMQIMVAVAICTIAGIVFKNVVLLGCVSILTLFLIKSKYSCNQYSAWQIILSIILGAAVAAGVIHIGATVSTQSQPVREYMEKPSNAKDDRSQADEMPELKLDGE